MYTNRKMVNFKPCAHKNCDLPAGVGPGAKLEVTLLVVEGEPGYVNLAR